ncbi:MAG: hypothetical protein JJU21_16285 [Salinarimonas sp.]|nr:hypothetical protein [Salinarimonas sp.]
MAGSPGVSRRHGPPHHPMRTRPAWHFDDWQSEEKPPAVLLMVSPPVDTA